MADEKPADKPVEKNFLSIEEVEQVDDVRYLDVEVPEWKGWIIFGSLNAEDLIQWVEANEGTEKRNAGVRLINKSLVRRVPVPNQPDKFTYERIGTNTSMEALKKKDGKVLGRLADILLDLNGLLLKETDKDKKDSEKNGSGEAATVASPIVSH